MSKFEDSALWGEEEEEEEEFMPEYVLPEEEEEFEEGNESEEILKWEIPNFAKSPNSLLSPIYQFKYCTGKIGLAFNGNNNGACIIHLYDIKESCKYISCTVTLCSADRKLTLPVVGEEKFIPTEEEITRGKFIQLQIGLKKSEISNPASGFLFDGSTVMMTLRVDGYGDSKKETGYVGLENQGATCYMNSALQSLFHIPAFRNIVYNMETDGTEDVKTCIPLNLQRLFYKMQFNQTSVSTKALTESFGWGDLETFTQHDIQEFVRVLMDNLETKMKGTPNENAISDLFKGKTRSYVRCLNVSYESSREEDFYDLSLVVKGCKNLEASFEKYCEEDRMDGDNQYQTDEFGKQDAIMGVEFVELPKVLHLHLGRFEYNYDYDQMMKITDRFEFPEVIDLGRFCSDKQSRVYELFGVLVHMGSYGAGHYYAFLRPTSDVQWYKFDDDWVTLEEKELAIEDNFGGRGPTGRSKYYSGYMLVYVKQSEIENVLRPIADEDVPSHLKDFLSKEKEEIEAMRNARMEAAKSVYVCVQDTTTLINATMQGRSGFVTHECLFNKKVSKDMSTAELYKTVAEGIEMNVDEIRLWRVDPTDRHPYEVLHSGDDLSLRNVMDDPRMNCLYLFMQTKTEEDALTMEETSRVLFCKFFFPEAAAKIQYITDLELTEALTLGDAGEMMNSILGFPEGSPLLTYIESATGETQLVDTEATIGELQIENGTMVIFQLPPGIHLETTFEFEDPQDPPKLEIEEEDKLEEEKRPDVPMINADDIFFLNEDTVDKYLDKKHSQIEVDVYDYNDDMNPLFTLTFSAIMPMIQLKRTIAAAAKIEFNPAEDSMLLYEKDLIADEPAREAVASTHRTAFIFAEHVPEFKERQRIYMQVIKGVNEAELKTMTQYVVHLSLDGYTVSKTVEILEKKRITCGDLTESVKETLNLTIDGPFRWAYMHGGQRLNRIKLTEDSVIDFSFYPIRIDVIPEEQQHLEENESLVEVCFYTPHPWNERLAPIYDSFLLKIVSGETFADTKVRIEEHLSEELKPYMKNAIFEVLLNGTTRRIPIKDGDDTQMKIMDEDKLYMICKQRAAAKRTQSTESVKIFN